MSHNYFLLQDMTLVGCKCLTQEIQAVSLNAYKQPKIQKMDPIVTPNIQTRWARCNNSVDNSEKMLPKFVKVR